MPSGSIATGSPYTLTVNGTCPPVDTLAGMPAGAVDPPNIGLFVAVKVVPVSTGNSYSAYTRKCTYGPSDIAMESVGVIDCAGSPVNGWIEVFFLKNVTPATGASSKVVYTNRNLADNANDPVKSIVIDTITYSRVDQITPNSISATAFTGSSVSMYATSAVSKQVVGFFACSTDITGASAGTQRLATNLGSGVGNAGNGSIVDTPGDTVAQVTALGAGYWGGIVLSIDHTTAPNNEHHLTEYNQIGDSKSILAVQSPPPASGLSSVDFDFSAYPDSSSFLSDFTVSKYVHTGDVLSGTLGIKDGLARMVNLGTYLATRVTVQAMLNTPLRTDCVDVSCIPTGASGSVVLQARCSGSNGTTLLSLGDGVLCEIFFPSPEDAETYPPLITVFIIGSTGAPANGFTVAFTPIKGARYKLRCGMVVDGVEYPHRYQVLINDVPQTITSAMLGGYTAGLKYFDDWTAYSDLSKKKVGFASTIADLTPLSNNTAEHQTDMPLRYWGAQDQTDGAVYVDSNVSTVKTQGPIILPAGTGCQSVGSLEVAYRLEIPSDSTLEILPVTPPTALNPPVPIDGWTPANMASNSIWGRDGYDMVLVCGNTGTGTDSWGYEYLTYPTAPFQLDVELEWAVGDPWGVPSGANQLVWSGITISDGTKLITFGPYAINTNQAAPWWGVNQGVVGYKWTTVTSVSGSVTTWAPPVDWLGGMPRHYRIVDDGTNRSMSYSLNGKEYTNFFTEARGAFLTATQIGIGGSNRPASGFPHTTRVKKWKVS